MRAVSSHWLLALITAGVLVLASDLRAAQAPGTSAVIDGPYAHLLAASADLGPTHRGPVQLTAALHHATRPDALITWAGQHGMTIRWRPGHTWAIVEGAPDRVADAFEVAIHDYRGQQGQVFYASPHQPAVPDVLQGEVDELGRILGYTPHKMSLPWILPLDVPDRGLTPSGLLKTYNAEGLAAQGFTGKGTTIVIFAFDGYDQADLDSFTTLWNLPPLNPVLIGGQPGEPRGETTMDLEVAHAIAPDARKVVINARPTVEGDGAYEKIGQMLESADQQFPGAVWSFSIGWGCDKLLTAADLAPVRSALSAAHARGTTAFNASGDLAGLECKGGQDWSSPPGPDDIGLDSVASLPEMTDVGGTTLSTTADGAWLGEQAWFDVPLSLGTGGGASALFDRPEWQRAVSGPGVTDENAGRRLTPDIAAVADPFTGVRIVFNQKNLVGGGTSQSAPIWAGLAAVINQYLTQNGGRLIGDLNPQLYRIAAGAPFPAFRDVTLGGNAVASAGPGYDMATGLGTPDVENLAKNLLALQRANR
ncbi:peptidase S53 [Mycolicibacterium wolinskyi]|uniref:Peptidase S53 n=1 Tax=Mycolicibacterium wolinskyi TaxID=59750 RepID=A0A1X2EZX6_9MYCO|nr:MULTISPECIES: S53 family peptidase [Mycolicibacterium]MCV7288522.1 peptidase S53 [Mycolicibacterium wolinskyi]MCV7295744.1 peptidase S53 [Mycolicibacterium goodii]ORX11751.1 peptidase S53 [Mycolicibacterium wolinskyi]